MKFLLRSFVVVILLSVQSFAQDGSTNQPAQAQSGLQISSRSDEDRCKFLIQVASAYFKENDFSSAINAYERVLEIDPEHKEARYVIGHVYIKAKHYAKAEAQLRSLMEDYPDDFQIKNNLAWLYATAEDPLFRDGEKAVLLAQEAMVMAPYDHHVWSTLAEAHYVSGEYEKAFRAITHMAKVAARYGKNITKESVDGYNEQIRKCKRAWDAEKMLNEDEDTATDEN